MQITMQTLLPVHAKDQGDPTDADIAKWCSFLYWHFQAYEQKGDVLLVSNLSAILMYAVLIPTITVFGVDAIRLLKLLAETARRHGDGGQPRNVIFQTLVRTINSQLNHECIYVTLNKMPGSSQPREQFEELLGRNSSGSGSRKSKVTVGGTRCADHVTPSIR
jgi:hypothetical protein